MDSGRVPLFGQEGGAPHTGTTFLHNWIINEQRECIVLSTFNLMANLKPTLLIAVFFVARIAYVKRVTHANAWSRACSLRRE